MYLGPALKPQQLDHYGPRPTPTRVAPGAAASDPARGPDFNARDLPRTPRAPVLPDPPGAQARQHPAARRGPALTKGATILRWISDRPAPVCVAQVHASGICGTLPKRTVSSWLVHMRRTGQLASRVLATRGVGGRGLAWYTTPDRAAELATLEPT